MYGKVPWYRSTFQAVFLSWTKERRKGCGRRDRHKAFWGNMFASTSLLCNPGAGGACMCDALLWNSRQIDGNLWLSKRIVCRSAAQATPPLPEISKCFKAALSCKLRKPIAAVVEECSEALLAELRSWCEREMQWATDLESSWHHSAALSISRRPSVAAGWALNCFLGKGLSLSSLCFFWHSNLINEAQEWDLAAHLCHYWSWSGWVFEEKLLAYLIAHKIEPSTCNWFVLLELKQKLWQWVCGSCYGDCVYGVSVLAFITGLSCPLPSPSPSADP